MFSMRYLASWINNIFAQVEVRFILFAKERTIAGYLLPQFTMCIWSSAHRLDGEYQPCPLSRLLFARYEQLRGAKLSIFLFGGSSHDDADARRGCSTVVVTVLHFWIARSSAELILVMIAVKKFGTSCVCWLTLLVGMR